MYTHHKVEAMVIFVVVAILSFLAGAAYKDMALAALTVVTISFAVYIAAMSTLLGSPYADRLKAIADKKIKTKSQLGVLNTYLRVAGKTSVLTIAISSLYQFTTLRVNNALLSQIISSLSCGVFALNIFFLWLIFSFLSSALITFAQKK